MKMKEFKDEVIAKMTGDVFFDSRIKCYDANGDFDYITLGFEGLMPKYHDCEIASFRMLREENSESKTPIIEVTLEPVRKEYIVEVAVTCSSNFCVTAENEEDACDIAEAMFVKSQGDIITRDRFDDVSELKPWIVEVKTK